MILREVLDLDRKLFVVLNGLNSKYLNEFMFWMSDKYIWLPFYAMLFVFIIKKFKVKAFKIFILLVVLITLTDQLSSSVMKPYFKRNRPSHNIELSEKIHISEAGKGGQYGFVSSHAANSFALFFFISFLFKKENKKMVYLILAWAILVSYSRIYNGVHYPLDILGGILVAFLSTKFVLFISKKIKLIE